MLDANPPTVRCTSIARGLRDQRDAAFLWKKTTGGCLVKLSNTECSVEIRAEKSFMRVALAVGLLFMLLTAGCAGIKPRRRSHRHPPRRRKPGPNPWRRRPNRPRHLTRRLQLQRKVGPLQSSRRALQQRRRRALPQARAIPRPPRRREGAASRPPAQATKKDSTPPDVAKPKAPPLDLASLETRLKETKAIGVLSKIAIRNQVDDLLDQFRAFYQGKLKTTLAELRRPYDLLVLKVLSLLQDSDRLSHPRSWRRERRSGAFLRILRSSQRSNSTQETP